MSSMLSQLLLIFHIAEVSNCYSDEETKSLVKSLILSLICLQILTNFLCFLIVSVLSSNPLVMDLSLVFPSLVLSLSQFIMSSVCYSISQLNSYLIDLSLYFHNNLVSFLIWIVSSVLSKYFKVFYSFQRRTLVSHTIHLLLLFYPSSVSCQRSSDCKSLHCLVYSTVFMLITIMLLFKQFQFSQQESSVTF